MTTTRIYYPDKLTLNGQISLNTATSHHVLRVLRIRVGDDLIIFNGTGDEFGARLAKIKGKHALIDVLTQHTVHTESPLNLELGHGLARAERMDYVIQKAVELGVTHITPLLTTRCNVKLDAQRLAKRLAHWQTIIIHACEQSGRCSIPSLASAQTLGHWLTQKQDGLRCVCDPHTSCGINQLPHIGQIVTVLVGPEGGLTPVEIQQACNSGFIPLSLGPRILRTETAAVTALTLVQQRYGDLG